MSKFRILVENIIQEDGKADKARHQEAVQIYLDLTDAVNARLSKKSGSTRLYSGDEDLVYELKTPYGPLIVVLDPEINHSHVGEYFTGQNMLCIYPNEILEAEEDKDQDKPYITKDDLLYALGLAIVQRTFLHEYTHFVDEKKTKVINYPKNLNKDDQSSYLNYSREKNAFFIEWLNDFVVELYNKYGKALRYIDTNKKIDFIRSVLNNNEQFKEYFNYLNPKGKKRFMGRLYSYFTVDTPQAA